MSLIPIGRGHLSARHGSELSPGSLAIRAEIDESAVISRALLHFRQFLVRNQERREKCKKLATTGVQTPGRPPT